MPIPFQKTVNTKRNPNFGMQPEKRSTYQKSQEKELREITLKEILAESVDHCVTCQILQVAKSASRNSAAIVKYGLCVKCFREYQKRVQGNKSAF